MNDFASNIARVRRAFVGAVFVAAALTAPAGADAPRGAARAATSVPAPPTDALRNALDRRKLHTLDGQAVTWASLRGEVVVVNFWATWCKPCQKELPRLDALDKELEKSGGVVLAVSVDLDAENVRRFAKANKLHLPICHDGPDGLAREMALEMLPYTVVLDRNGTLAYATSGSDEAHLDALVAKVRSLAAEPKTALSNEVAP